MSTLDHARASDGARRSVLQINAPASSWAAIIGKGGETLRSLQKEHNVSIRVPRPDAPANQAVTVRGHPDACAACDAAIQKIVQSISRGKDKQKSKVGSKGSSKSLFPSKCSLCGKGITSLAEAFDHIGSTLHLTSLQAKSSLLSVLEVAEFLKEPEYQEVHLTLGFDVDELVNRAPEEMQRRVNAKALEDEVSMLKPDFNWLRLENRWLVRWDASAARSEAKSILEAPNLEEMVARCVVDHVRPPVVRLPQLPSPLPRLDPKARRVNPLKGKHMWPFDPSSRLGIAVIHKLGLRLEEFDVVCGTSLIHALSGDLSRTKDDFYLQRYRGTLCCLHVPKAFHTDDDAGHAVENLLCGAARQECSFIAASYFSIGSTRVLVTSEVDATDSDGRVIELKSSSTKGFIKNKVVLQVAVNGSDFVLGCTLNKDKSHLQEIEWISAAETIQGHAESFIAKGQRVRLLLDRLVNHTYLDIMASSTTESNIMKLTFDEIKAPVLSPAEAGITVLPQGLL